MCTLTWKIKHSAWSKGQLSVSNMNLINNQYTHLMPMHKNNSYAFEINHLNYDGVQGLSEFFHEQV